MHTSPQSDKYPANCYTARVKPLSLVILFPALVTLAASAAEVPLVEADFIDVHGEHIKLVENTMSPDGRYAAGWTVVPKKGKPAVDWKQWHAENNSFYDDYLDNQDYTVTDVIVDLAKKSVAARLQFKSPYFDSKGHGALEIVYGPVKDGHRYALALSDSKWSALDVNLIDIGPEGSTQADIHKLLDETALGYARKQGKKKTGDYACDYQLFSLPELGLRTGFFDYDKIRVPVVAAVPKEGGGLSGTIQLKLSTANGKPKAEPGEVRETPGDVDPATDDPRIVAADGELNSVYKEVQAKLDKAGKAKLVAEQRLWLKNRDTLVANVTLEHTDKSFVNNPRIAQDQKLLELTRKRIEELKALRK